MNLSKFCIFLFSCLLTTSIFAQSQTGGVRGTLLDKDSGEPLPFATVFLQGTEFNATTDMEGFYSITNVPAGEYVIQGQFLGYDSLTAAITIPKARMVSQNLMLAPSVNEIGVIDVTEERFAEQNDVRVSVIRVTPKEINRIPSAGGEPDFAQYMQVIPGVVFTGDQGGQLYIRGGAPIQNKMLLDGMTIFNAFHSIGFFSVFETDLIRSADVYTGGFSAKYGGRSSAVVDIKTRGGNKKRFSGMVGVSPFVVKGLFEGPLVKLSEENGSSLSFLASIKHSYLNVTSPIFYPYAAEGGVLPYSFTDFYTKLAFNASNGSRLNVFGFSFNDNVNFENVATYNWKSGGAGLDFRIIPGAAKFIMDGTLGYSTYKADFVEGDSLKERASGINNFNADFNFIYLLADNRQMDIGFELNSFFTDFAYVNNQGVPFDQQQSNTEISAYVRYKGRFGPIVIEPSVRGHFYASLGEFRVEPRIGMKYNITEFFRFKFAGGMYSQNLISSVDERDVVNLFVGFIGGPDEGVFRISTNENGSQIYTKTKSRLQTSVHAIGGFEVNAGRYVTLNIEPYWKYFPQIIALNRNRTDANDIVEYIAETGNAYGVDFSGKYEKDQLYLYLAYSLGYVNRDDGLQQFPAHFDRRHNANFVASYEFGKPKENNGRNKEYPFEVSLRWNLGSGFPFTLTKGFYPLQSFEDGITSNIFTNNNSPDTELGVIYDEEINGGRLPYYHRLDFSFKYTAFFSKYLRLQVAAGVTNMYNRENIFYFDRIRYERINQLPIMPSLSLNLKF